MARLTKTELAADKARREAIWTAHEAIVATGACPSCGGKLKRNLSLWGWWQCEQSGAVGWRKDATRPACDFQVFTR
jgi:hypothetical protein